ncbi:MAG: hypothetical protein H3C34_20920 [Caldilineaceae bacterium]|nr:hypothetical protein [Caldilineaceae bacterium]
MTITPARTIAMTNEEAHLAGTGRIYERGQWIATVSYGLFVPGDSSLITGEIDIEDGATDLAVTPERTRRLVLELEDGSWCQIVPIRGRAQTARYAIALIGPIQPAPRPRLNGPWQL